MAAISRDIRFLTRLLEAANHCRVEAGADPSKIRLVLPKFQPQGLNPIGAEAVPVVVALFSATRQSAWSAGYLNMARLRQTGHTFITAQRYRFYSPMDIQSNKTVSNDSWSVDIGLSYTGYTSFYTRASLTGPTGLLVDSDTCWVYADKDTRKKAQIPDWFREKFSPNPSPNITPDRISVPLVDWSTEKPVLQRRVISACDIDHFGHTNHSQYITLSVGSLKEAMKGYGLSHQSILTDPLWVLAQVDLVFLGESRAGDELEIGTVVVSTDEGIKRYLCHIRNGDSKKVISQMQFTFSRDTRLRSSL